MPDYFSIWLQNYDAYPLHISYVGIYQSNLDSSPLLEQFHGIWAFLMLHYLHLKLYILFYLNLWPTNVLCISSSCLAA